MPERHRKAARKVAAATVERSRRDRERSTNGNHVGVVVSRSPLVVKLASHDLRLDEDDITLGWSVRMYDSYHRLDPGDNLVLNETGKGGDWLAVDVLTDKPGDIEHLVAPKPHGH